MGHMIPATAIERYSSGPSPTTVAGVQSLHQNIRRVLGSTYDTFLQGSYRNDTGVADLNDVDIVALRTDLTSTVFNSSFTGTHSVTWLEIFADVRARLESTPEYRGRTVPGDKCITVNTNYKADVVPAIMISSADKDPIAIYSFGEANERKNYPRVHYENNVKKQANTSNNYKSTVRMFKRWARNWFGETKTAPSFYVECLMHSVPDDCFTSDGAITFFLVGNYITEKVSSSSVVMSVAGDKDILTSNEWDTARFVKFKTKLDGAVTLVAQALKATSVADAQYYWKKAFNE